LIRHLLIASVVLAATSLAGCFGGKNLDEECVELAEYQASINAPGIRAPEGMTLPGQTSGYVVPPGVDPEPKGTACLARPPPYFRPDPAAAPAPAAPPSSQAPPGD